MLVSRVGCQTPRSDTHFPVTPKSRDTRKNEPKNLLCAQSLSTRHNSRLSGDARCGKAIDSIVDDAREKASFTTKSLCAVHSS